MKSIAKRFAAVCAAVSLAVSLAACGGSSAPAAADSAAASAASSAAASAPESTAPQAGSDIINIAFTDTLGTLNPLNMDWTWINLYATSMMFLPLVSFNDDNYGIDYLLAESITTEDNQVFTVKIKEDAVWSDGEPVVADDVIFTILRMTSPEVANYNFDFSPFLGFVDGASPSGAEEIEGIRKVDDKTLEFVCADHMGLNTFINNVATWICILPSHVLKDVPADQLLSSDWFNHPDVISGPYMLDSYDAAHYITYKANEKYFAGAPKIGTVNFRIVDGSQILAGLQAGELDMVHPSSSIPTEDRPSVEALEGFTSQYTDPIINQMTFFNTSKITDARVRQAIVYAIDRQQLVDVLLAGQGEVTDGFICSASPFFDKKKTVISYDPAKAKELLEEAGWDSSQVIEYYCSSGDENVVKAAAIMQQSLKQVGVEIHINTVDFATLMDVAGTDEVDMFSVQYTITPNDYWADEVGLINLPDSSWSGGYFNETVDAGLAATQETNDEKELFEIYKQIEEQIIADTPVFPLYFLSNLGVVSNRLLNAKAAYYGAFDNIQEWEIAA